MSIFEPSPPPLDVTDYNPNLIILIVSFWYYLLYLYQA